MSEGECFGGPPPGKFNGCVSADAGSLSTACTKNPTAISSCPNERGLLDRQHFYGHDKQREGNSDRMSVPQRLSCEVRPSCRRDYYCDKSAPASIQQNSAPRDCGNLEPPPSAVQKMNCIESPKQHASKKKETQQNEESSSSSATSSHPMASSNYRSGHRATGTAATNRVIIGAPLPRTSTSATTRPPSWGCSKACTRSPHNNEGGDKGSSSSSNGASSHLDRSVANTPMLPYHTISSSSPDCHVHGHNGSSSRSSHVNSRGYGIHYSREGLSSQGFVGGVRGDINSKFHSRNSRGHRSGYRGRVRSSPHHGTYTHYAAVRSPCPAEAFTTPATAHAAATTATTATTASPGATLASLPLLLVPPAAAGATAVAPAHASAFFSQAEPTAAAARFLPSHVGRIYNDSPTTSHDALPVYTTAVSGAAADATAITAGGADAIPAGGAAALPAGGAAAVPAGGAAAMPAGGAAAMPAGGAAAMPAGGAAAMPAGGAAAMPAGGAAAMPAGGADANANYNVNAAYLPACPPAFPRFFPANNGHRHFPLQWRSHGQHYAGTYRRGGYRGRQEMTRGGRREARSAFVGAGAPAATATIATEGEARTKDVFAEEGAKSRSAETHTTDCVKEKRDVHAAVATGGLVSSQHQLAKEASAKNEGQKEQQTEEDNNQDNHEKESEDEETRDDDHDGDEGKEGQHGAVVVGIVVEGQDEDEEEDNEEEGKRETADTGEQIELETKHRPVIPSEDDTGADHHWTFDEQKKLEEALIFYRRMKNRAEMWKLIGNFVSSRTPQQCLRRFKLCREAALLRVQETAAEEKEDETPREDGFEQSISNGRRTMLSTSCALADSAAESSSPTCESDSNSPSPVAASSVAASSAMETPLPVSGPSASAAVSVPTTTTTTTSEARLAAQQRLLRTVQPQQQQTVRGVRIVLRQPKFEGISAVHLSTLKLLVACSRCSQAADLKVSPAGDWSTLAVAGTTADCGTCHMQLRLRAMPKIFFAVGAADSTVATVEAMQCGVRDLLPSDYLLTCAGCSAATRVREVFSGSCRTTLCRNCHLKLTFSFQSAYVEGGDACTGSSVAGGGAAGASDATTLAKQQQKKKKQQEMVFKLGTPLPDNGTCKHYKKSFRWLRFPCCGKAFACDLCHDEATDHEHTWATRMICGFCSREQPYAASKPCQACGHSVTKDGKSAHWEGGKGCRDATRMSRRDPKKYKLLHKQQSRTAGGTGSKS